MTDEAQEPWFRRVLYKLGGRKFILALAAPVAVALAAIYGVSESTVYVIAGIIASYILAEGGKDIAAALGEFFKNKTTQLVLLVSMLLCASGCGFSRPKEINEAEQTKRKAMIHFADGASVVQSATLSGYKNEAVAHAETKHAWDQEKIEAKAQELIIRKANEAGKAPKDVAISAVELQEFAAHAHSWAEKTAAELKANKAKVDASAVNIEVLIAKYRKDLVTALELQDMLDNFYNAGVPMEMLQQASGVIGSLLLRDPPNVPVPAPAP